MLVPRVFWEIGEPHMAVVCLVVCPIAGVARGYTIQRQARSRGNEPERICGNILDALFGAQGN